MRFFIVLCLGVQIYASEYNDTDGAAIRQGVHIEWYRTIAPGNSGCLLYTSPSPRDRTRSRMPSSA